MPADDKLVATGQIGTVGIFQIDIFAPKNSGSEAAMKLRMTIARAFEPATSIFDSASGTAVAIDKCKPLPGVNEAVWYRLSLQVTYRSYAYRAQS
jgi:hypothetical protein